VIISPIIQRVDPLKCGYLTVKHDVASQTQIHCSILRQMALKCLEFGDSSPSSPSPATTRGLGQDFPFLPIGRVIGIFRQFGNGNHQRVRQTVLLGFRFHNTPLELGHYRHGSSFRREPSQRQPASCPNAREK